MTALFDKMDTALAPFSAPVAFFSDKRPTDKNVSESTISLTRGRAERKSIIAERRITKFDGVDRKGFQCQKSQSAGDLPSFRIRASASSSSGNGPASGGTVNSTRLSGIDSASENQAGNNTVLTTSSKSSELQQQHQQRHNKTESSATLATLSSSTLLDSASPMNVSDASAEGDAGRKLAHRERRFRRLFRNVPTTEVLLCRYSCAYVSAGLLLQGHLYVSNRWICFHSNVFGIEKIIEIPAESVTAVTKAKTAKIIPNAVKIKTDGKYYLFGSLISRDNTYRLLVNVTSKGRRGEVKNVNKHDFTGGPYGNVSSTLREIGDDFDDGTSTSSGLSTESSSSSPAGDQRARSNSVRASTPGVGAVEEPEPVVWRRLFQSNGSNQKPQSGDAASRSREKGKGNGSRKSTSSSIPSLLTWFFGLPKTIAILIICVGLVMFLFLCATVLTIRLIYIRSPSGLKMDFVPRNFGDEDDNVLLSHQSLDTMGTLVDHTLKIMDEVKRYLESLKLEVRNGLTEAAVSVASSSAGETA